MRLFAEEIPKPPEPVELRPPDTRERALLEDAGNSCPDWDGVLLGPDCRLDSIRNCRLLPPLTLDLRGSSASAGGRTAQVGISGSTLSSCALYGAVHVSGVGLLEGMMLRGPTIVSRCGRIEAGGCSGFGIGSKMQLGVETGQRSLPLLPTLDVETAAHLTSGAGRELLERYVATVEEAAAVASACGAVIGEGSLLLDAGVISGSLLAGSVIVDGALALRNSLVLGAGDRPTRIADGALIRDSALQWGAVVDSMAVVESSIVGECSTVERHGKLLESYLGPDSCLGEGEITASLAGPFTAMHHQSLLIAARWPAGQGNVGYGANVGSNHTSRAPDQELHCGQGVFFGLGCSVKYPCSLERAPFSIVATGITLAPQRVELPFSLICRPGGTRKALPSGHNEIRPGWVVGHNLYSLWRSLRKYRRRRKARTLWSNPPVLCRKNAELVLRASAMLSELTGDGPWTGVPGAGANLITRRSMEEGMGAYRLFLGWYVMDAFLDSLAGGAAVGQELDAMPEHARRVVRRLRLEDSRELAAACLELAEELPELIRRSRSRDRTRGAEIIEDYAAMHRGTDPVVEDAETFFADIRRRLLTRYTEPS